MKQQEIKSIIRRLDSLHASLSSQSSPRGFLLMLATYINTILQDSDLQKVVNNLVDTPDNVQKEDSAGYVWNVLVSGKQSQWKAYKAIYSLSNLVVQGVYIPPALSEDSLDAKNFYGSYFEVFHYHLLNALNTELESAKASVDSSTISIEMGKLPGLYLLYGDPYYVQDDRGATKGNASKKKNNPDKAFILLLCGAKKRKGSERQVMVSVEEVRALLKEYNIDWAAKWSGAPSDARWAKTMRGNVNTKISLSKDELKVEGGGKATYFVFRLPK